MNLQQALELVLEERAGLVADGHELGSEDALLEVLAIARHMGARMTGYLPIAAAALHALVTEEEPVVGRALDEWLAAHEADAPDLVALMRAGAVGTVVQPLRPGEVGYVVTRSGEDGSNTVTPDA